MDEVGVQLEDNGLTNVMIHRNLDIFFSPSVQASSEGLQRLYSHVLLSFYLCEIDRKQS